MPSVQKILVPVDLSAASSRALAEARAFADAFGASIDLLYVWSTPTLVAPEAVITGVGINEQPLFDWIRHSANDQLAKFQANAEHAGINVHHSICEPGDPATSIVEHAKSGHYDLVVMGTHGRTGLSHVLLGSVTEKVVRRSPCPVLTVRTTD
ncbi:MAG TPA: universal stress protein [Polyangiaceae bacterium]|jgi:nucleotide-binding universal stress UspA family protein|nr:universal stress protein [Polyangiaceae bacterium]